MKVILYGAGGRMGKELLALIEQGFCGASIAAAIDKTYDYADDLHLSAFPDRKIDADVLIDFSNHTCIREIEAYARKYALPTVIATTGHEKEELEKIHALSQIVPVFYSANMSIGVAMLCSLAAQCASAFPEADIEIIEKHHSGKLDAPSGTALMLAQTLAKIRSGAALVFGRSGKRAREENEIGIHSVRAGSIVGEHEVIIAADSEILTVKHEAKNRAVFAEGALRAASWLGTKPAGLYGMRDLIDNP